MEDFRSRERENSESLLDPQLGGPISEDEIKEILNKMYNGKVKGPD